MAENENNPQRYQEKQKEVGREAALEQSDTGCQCPNCGNAVRLTADICENCAHWLKEGQCCFCYAEVKAGQKFCRECGNPPTGITCPNCKTFSHFDFCPNCNAALSKRALPYLDAFRQSPEFLELVQLGSITDYVSPASTVNDPALSQLDQLKAYLEKFEKKAEMKQLLVSFSTMKMLMPLMHCIKLHKRETNPRKKIPGQQIWNS
jgi:predicted amidophosphoribosyltransferase